MENRSGFFISGNAFGNAPARSDQNEDYEYRISETIALPIFVVDVQDCVSFANDAALIYSGYSKEEIYGKPASDIFRSEDLRRLSGSNRKGRKFDVELRQRDGERLWAEVYPSPLRNGSLELLVFDVTERKRQSEVLLEEKDFVESAINSLPGIFYLISEGRQFLRWNENFRDLSGYTDEEIAEMHPSHFFCEEDRGYIGARIQEVFETGESNAEKDFLTKDGRRIPHYFTGKRIIFDDQPCIVGMGIDISARVQAEKESLKLVSLVTSSGDAILGVDLQGNIESWNEGAASLYGYHASEIIGRHVSLLIPADRRKEEGDLMAKIKEDKQVNHYETIRLRKDGTAVPVSLTISPVKDRDGQITGASKIARDITRRKRTEDALRESEQRYRAFIKQSSEGIWRFELRMPLATDLPLSTQVESMFRDAYLAECNLAIAKQFKLSGLDELYGATLETLLPRFQEANVQLMEAFVKSNYHLSTYETRFIDNEGDEYFYLNNLTGIVDNGKLVRIWGTREDISAARQAENAYKESENQLRQSQKVEALGRLAGGIAHDFNNFLAVIMLHVDMLNLQLPVDSALRYRISEIKGVTDNAAGMVKQLLAYGRKQTMQPQPSVLNDVVAEFVKIVKPLTGESIEVELSLAGDLGVCFVDPHQMTQILMNLAVNSRDAMPKGGSIRFETFNTEVTEQTQIHKAQPFGHYVQMNVTDTGIGMDSATQAHIFEPFFTSKDAGKGTGLGLSTVYGIVKQSNGFIWVDSSPGEGASFKIFFPRIAMPANHVAPEKTESPVESMPGGTETVLLVEDEAQIRRVAVEVLSLLGYKVLEASDGVQALQLAGLMKEPIHLLLTDVMMPKMNGQDVANKMKDSHPESSVLFMSGYTNDIIASEGILEKDTNFLGKPFTPRTLALKVREVLDADSLTSR
jgi:two-component system, cell cycle sensor histidine kinase and response regulator CckA